MVRKKQLIITPIKNGVISQTSILVEKGLLNQFWNSATMNAVRNWLALVGLFYLVSLVI